MLKKQLVILLLISLIKNTNGMEQKLVPNSFGNLNKYEELQNQNDELQVLSNENNKLKSIMAQINNDEGYTHEVSPFLDKLQRKAAKQKERERLKQLVDLQQSQMRSLQNLSKTTQNALAELAIHNQKALEQKDKDWQDWINTGDNSAVYKPKFGKFLIRTKKYSDPEADYNRTNPCNRTSDEQFLYEQYEFKEYPHQRPHNRYLAKQKKIETRNEEIKKLVQTQKDQEFKDQEELWKKACADKHQEWTKYSNEKVQEQKDLVAARDATVSELQKKDEQWQKLQEQWKKACAETHQEWQKFVATKDATIASKNETLRKICYDILGAQVEVGNLKYGSIYKEKVEWSCDRINTLLEQARKKREDQDQ